VPPRSLIRENIFVQMSAEITSRRKNGTPLINKGKYICTDHFSVKKWKISCASFILSLNCQILSPFPGNLFSKFITSAPGQPARPRFARRRRPSREPTFRQQRRCDVTETTLGQDVGQKRRRRRRPGIDLTKLLFGRKLFGQISPKKLI
jgi:hypothetical protein